MIESNQNIELKRKIQPIYSNRREIDDCTLNLHLQFSSQWKLQQIPSDWPLIATQSRILPQFGSHSHDYSIYPIPIIGFVVLYQLKAIRKGLKSNLGKMGR